MSQIDNISDIDFFVAEQIKQYNKIPDDESEKFVEPEPQPQPEPEQSSTVSIIKKAAITGLGIAATAVLGSAIRKQFYGPQQATGRIGRERIIRDPELNQPRPNIQPVEQEYISVPPPIGRPFSERTYVPVPTYITAQQQINQRNLRN
tara:strand:+ start:1249 stop:1692 length:444 start_codon:yes stop_codon:yes gene_type:complete